MKKNLDLITIGRSSVDLYGEQVGGRLEDMGSFKKYIGGSPTNIAAGGSRLGLKTAVITKVGDEHMGRFIREELIREGVDVTAVKTDPERLTALVLLGIRDEDSFPLIFYRENCADMGLTEEDIDPDFIAKAKCLCATGTHLSNPITAAAVKKAVCLARQTGGKTALDIDYRPNLWGLGTHDEGENRFVASNDVTETILSTVGLFDLIVGTEEEFHIAGGSSDTLTALKNIRKRTKAILVCKRGPMGAVAFQEEIPDNFREGETGPGFNVEVFNVLGAGDGFMAGFLKGWLTGEDLSTSLKFANACGAFAVSRHGCTPAYPSLKELKFFLKNGSPKMALRNDFLLEQIHWSTNRRSYWKDLTVISLEDMLFDELYTQEQNPNWEQEEQFKRIIVDAMISARVPDKQFGIIFPVNQNRSLIDEITGQGLFLAKSVGHLGNDYSLEVEKNYENLSEWPLEHTVKIKLLVDKNSKAKFETQQHGLYRLFRYIRRNRLNLVLELDYGADAEYKPEFEYGIVNAILEAGIYPDFWIFDEPDKPEWEAVGQIIKDKDPYTQGILSLVDRTKQESSINLLPQNDPSSILTGRIISWAIFQVICSSWLSGTISNSEIETQITGWLMAHSDQ